jgi:radical SAM protein with 4Fe4S-binding SPASM domain
MKDAGFSFVSVSVDGLEESHDRQRGRQGSWKACFQTMSYLKEAGLLFGCNTQLNRLTAPEIPRLYEHVRAAGCASWQPQMTVPMGNAADNHWLLLQPVELLDLYPMLARVIYRSNAEGVEVMPGSSVGYYGPYDHVIRAHAYRRGQMWMGCQAGLSAIGIEADGKVKGDPSLPTDAYTAGNIRQMPLRKILDEPLMKINMGGGTPEGTKHLWGFCKTCKHAEICRGGCSWSTHVFFNRRGNNVYCHHRALEMQRKGRRERVVQKLMAIGKPFDNGVFEIIEEPFDAPWPEPDPLRFTAEKVVWPKGWEAWPAV